MGGLLEHLRYIAVKFHRRTFIIWGLRPLTNSPPSRVKLYYKYVPTKLRFYVGRACSSIHDMIIER